jgi:hypothetical protein
LTDFFSPARVSGSVFSFEIPPRQYVEYVIDIQSTGFQLTNTLQRNQFGFKLSVKVVAHTLLLELRWSNNVLFTATYSIDNQGPR